MLQASSSSLVGKIPTQIGNLRRLRFLFLANNRLSGTFPSLLTSLESLEDLSLSRNNFRGPISRHQWEFMGRLNDAPINGNKFTGTLPNDIGSMLVANQKYFNVNYNELSGTLPNSFARVTSLLWLEVDFNRLTGTIPGNLSVSMLSLRGNNFTGEVPASTCQSVVDNDGYILHDCNSSLICTCNCRCGA